MRTVDRTSTEGRKLGGLAAMYLAAALLLAMPFFLVVVKYPSVVDPAEKVALIASHQGSMHAMYLITYVVFGIALAVLALALHQRLASAGPVIMRVASAVGLMWACVLVASGMVFNAGMAAVADAYPTDPGRAASIWQTIEPIAQGLGGAGGEILGGLWILLVSFAGFRTNGLPKPLTWLGLAAGVVGILSVVPALNDAAQVFGLLLIGWLMWLGIVMTRTAKSQSEPIPSNVEVAQT